MLHCGARVSINTTLKTLETALKEIVMKYRNFNLLSVTTLKTQVKLVVTGATISAGLAYYPYIGIGLYGSRRVPKH